MRSLGVLVCEPCVQISDTRKEHWIGTCKILVTFKLRTSRKKQDWHSQYCMLQISNFTENELRNPSLHHCWLEYSCPQLLTHALQQVQITFDIQSACRVQLPTVTNNMCCSKYKSLLIDNQPAISKCSNHSCKRSNSYSVAGCCKKDRIPVSLTVVQAELGPSQLKS